MSAVVTRTKQAKGLARSDALDMFRHQRGKRYTYYSCGVIDDAMANNVGINVIDEYTGKVVLTRTRMVHRRDLLATFGRLHDRAGEGKYVEQSALSHTGQQTLVKGANNVNPFILEKGSNHTIAQAFHSLTGISKLRQLVGEIRVSRLDGQHVHWLGDRNPADAVLVSPWVTKQVLWEKARDINPKLVAALKGKVSRVKNVSAHLGAFDKFCQNLDVLRRFRLVLHVNSGRKDLSGGATPCGMPLEQCQFAIDMFYLTTGVDRQGEEVGDYFFRMAYGRSYAQVLHYNDWVGLDVNSPFAYLNAKTLLSVKRSQKKAA